MNRFRVTIYLNRNNMLVFVIDGSDKVTIGEVPFNKEIKDDFFDKLYEEYCKVNRRIVTRKYFDKATYEATKRFAIQYITNGIQI